MKKFLPFAALLTLLLVACQSNTTNDQAQSVSSSSQSSLIGGLSSSAVGTKTYRNDQYGFEFEYPNAWIIGKERITQRPGNDIVFNDGSPEILIQKAYPEDIQFFKEALKPYMLNASDLHVGGEVAIRVDLKENATAIVFHHDGYFYTLSMQIGCLHAEICTWGADSAGVLSSWRFINASSNASL